MRPNVVAIMALLRLCLVLLLTQAGIWAQARMTVEQVRQFVQSSRRLGHSDKQVAEYLRKVKLSERLEPGAIEDLQADGAGPRTVEALKAIAEASKTLAAPPPPARITLQSGRERR